MKSGIIELPPTKKHTNGNAKDRISELPDSVLHHILSFLKTKDTVQTSILSKRWTHLWASVPALDFTDESFIKNGGLHFRGSHKYKFENFVDTVLLLRDASDLRSFSLRLYDYFDRGHLHRWIHHATKYNCKVLQITLPWGYKHCRLPMSILPWQSLEELSTSNGAIFGPSKTMVRLRRLQIQVAHLKRGLMENLISSCPVLEDLCLDNCELDALCISSNTLKRLSIKHCKIGGNENLISIPGLVCLTYTDSWGCCTTLRNLSSLLNATVHTSGHDAIELIRAVANVETLNFSCLEGYQCKLPEDPSQLPTFDNLRSLTLVGKCTSDMIQVVAFFLQRSPNLKTFTLNTRRVSPQSLSRWKVVVPELVDALLHLPTHRFNRDPVF